MNQTALITGASSGIGKEFATQLAAKGMDVILVARSTGKLQELATELQTQWKVNATVITADLSKEYGAKDVYKQTQELGLTVDYLVNNAGFGLYGALEDVPLVEARYQFEVNVFGLARLTQLLVPHMRKKRAGKIINISSMGGKIYTPLGGWYHATKHALEGLSDCLRLELQPFGIHVVVIEPGLIQTEFGSVVEGLMLKHSGKGPYADLAARVARAMASAYKDGGGSSPQLIADVVSRAVKARRPKTRYAAGRYACAMIQSRRWLGDRIFDRLVLSTVR